MPDGTALEIRKELVMKILLVSDVKKLGWFGDVLEVNAGYARNYLLPEGLAIIPTEANLKSLAAEKAMRAEQRIVERKRLEEAAAAAEGKEAVIAAKANEQGHLFGSVSKEEIAVNLREQGLAVADDVVQLPEHIKEAGTHIVKLRFADDLIVSVNVIVVAEPSPSSMGGAEQKDSSFAADAAEKEKDGADDRDRE